MAYNNSSHNLFGRNQDTLFGSKITEHPLKPPFLRPEASPSTLFGQQGSVNFGIPASNQQQPNSSVGFPKPNLQPNTNVFGIQKPQEILDKNSQKLDILLQYCESLNLKINNLTKGLNEFKPEKELYVVCPQHEHPIIETTCNKICDSSYNNGFSCDICKIQVFNKDTIMYHCKTCHQIGELYDTCENCIRNCLKKR